LNMELPDPMLPHLRRERGQASSTFTTQAKKSKERN
jgi:hypothetical protein